MINDKKFSIKALWTEARKNKTTRKLNENFQKWNKNLDELTTPEQLSNISDSKLLNIIKNIRLSLILKSQLKNTKKIFKKNIFYKDNKTKQKTIHQIVPILSPRDAIGSEVLLIQQILQKMGFNSEIFVEHVHPEMSSFCSILPSNGSLNANAIIYHHAIGSNLIEKVLSSQSKKILIYHNITPEKYFINVNETLAQSISKGRTQLKNLINKMDLTITHSEYSAEELERLGYSNIKIIPFMLDLKSHDILPINKIISKHNDTTNFLCVGRIMPHKKIEDVIKIFSYYNKCINSNSKLFIVGNYLGSEKYYLWLKNITKTTKLKDVYFILKASLQELISYYKIADVFVSMSEHEGFGVPLVESMYHKIPIFANSKGAIPEVLGKSGILIEDNDLQLISELINIVLSDKKIKDDIVNDQNEQLRKFDLKDSQTIFTKHIQSVLPAE